MDSLEIITMVDIEDWAVPHIQKVVNEVKESKGKITSVKKHSFIIEIMSNISNLTRYDQISKHSTVTYSLPSNLDKEMKNFILFSN
jgi:hypothetical protein